MKAPRMQVLGIVLAAGTPTAFLFSKSDESAAAEARLIEANGASGFNKTAIHNDDIRRTDNNTVRLGVSANR
jgi:hypothetical protein